MLNDSARWPLCGGAESLSLDTVWRVDADNSYDVSTHPSKNHLLIAVRTLAGGGGVTFRTGREAQLGEGSLIFFRYADISRYRCRGGRWFFWWWECTAPGAKDIPLGIVRQLPVSSTESGQLENAFGLMRSGRPASAAWGRLLMQERLGRYLHETDQHGDRPATPQAAVETAISTMRGNLCGMDMGTLAREACLGERRFRQVFRQVTGEPPKQYYDSLRIEHAAQLLLHSPLSARQVADRLGFSSQFHFSRAFKKKFGQSPALWRARP